MTTAAPQSVQNTPRRYRPYPRYKDSGVEWLGEIPAHWEVKRLKHLCSRSAVYGANEPADAYESEGARFLRTTDITDGGRLVGDGVYLPVDTVHGYLLEDGDILFSRSGTIGRSFLYRKSLHGACAYAGYLVRFVPGPMLDSCFAFYFSKSKSFERWLGGAVIASTIGNVNGQKFANVEMPCPPYNDQRAIAAFLDRETARIDAMIEKKRRQIELLQEKRAALISHAVTKGLDPNAPMRDSGVEWLGEIPADWEVKRLKYLATLNPESLADDTDPTLEMVYVDIGGVDNLGRIGEREQLTFASAPSRARRLVRDGDVILSTVRTYLRAIAPIRNPEPGMVVSTGFAVVRPEDDLTTDYAAYALRAPYFVERIVANSKGVSYPAINESEIATYELAGPPLPEQRAIAAFLDRETARIDALAEKVEKSIDLLREYRTALISAAVTGKIDVREEAA